MVNDDADQHLQRPPAAGLGIADRIKQLTVALAPANRVERTPLLVRSIDRVRLYAYLQIQAVLSRSKRALLLILLHGNAL